MPSLLYGARQARGISLSRAFFTYLTCLLVMLVVLKLAYFMRDDFSLTQLAIAAVGGYVALGITLNRAVLRHLITWSRMWATISNISSARLHIFVLWPIMYPVLFIELLIVKVL